MYTAYVLMTLCFVKEMIMMLDSCSSNIELREINIFNPL